MRGTLAARAALVDLPRLAVAQRSCDLVAAESCLQDAFAEDIRPLLREWRRARGFPEDPLAASRDSGYLDRIARERTGRSAGTTSAYA